jgi:hypothetical protein
MFCSGDMLVENVQLKLGSQLAFNDLPSSITVDFTLTNARPWGLQEIMAKFNSGYLRTVDVQKSFYETKTLPNTKPADSQTEPLGYLPLDLSQEGIYKVASTASNTGTSGAVPTTPTTNTNSSGSAGTSGTSGGSRV